MTSTITSLAAAATTTLKGKESEEKRFGRELRKDFMFDEGYVNLNHGSFGTYPSIIRTHIRSLQDRAEGRPDNFIRYEYPLLLDQSREAIAGFVNTSANNIVFVPNATTAVNIVLRNLIYQPGDQILYLSNIYGACEKTIEYITETTPAQSLKVPYTLPVEDSTLVSAVETAIKKAHASGLKIRVAIFDTIVSMPGVRLPFERLTKVCKENGVLSCIDGAHGVGHIALDLTALDPDFFVSNCHKWLLSPRGCAVFYVPERNQHLLRSTLPTSHGFIPKGVKISTPLPSVGVKSPWVKSFEFIGTIDYSPYLCIPAALEYRKSLGGEDKILSYCQNLAREAADRTAVILGTEVLDNSTKSHTNCCLTNVRVPLNVSAVKALAVAKGVDEDDIGVLVRDWMSKVLVDEYGTFMALLWYDNNWWVRWSAQVYLELKDFEWAAETLKVLCGRVEKGEFLLLQSKL